MRRFIALATIILLQVSARALEHFEARHLHPLDITPDGHTLVAVNAIEGRLSIFDLTIYGPSRPILLHEIPVGLEPVTVRTPNNTEAWVVNELSDTVTIVDLPSATIVEILSTPDEPADLAFTPTHAWLSCARSREILGIRRDNHSIDHRIPIQGNMPRGVALSPDQSKLYIACLLSGNETTTLHFRQAPPQASPTNPDLPAPPQVGQIVKDSDPRIPYDVLDHDVIEIDLTFTHPPRYYSDFGTNLFAIITLPNGQIWCGTSDAQNLIRFEPELNGIFARSEIVRFHPQEDIHTTRYDLNPQTNRPLTSDPEKALSQVMSLCASPDGQSIYLAAFGSDRLAKVNLHGEIISNIDLRFNHPTPRGPRGLVHHPSSPIIYCFQKLSDTIQLIDTSTETLLTEIPISTQDPLPEDQRLGRSFFYDARRSGNGTVSCGSCHFDADLDGIAWDLGDPGGQLTTVIGYNLALGETQPIDRIMHPMKGPMVTQTLRGIKGTAPFHWRGDTADIASFNKTFPNLLSASLLNPQEVSQLVSYIESLRNHPNPNRTIDNRLPDKIGKGNPSVGQQRFNELNICSKCHSGSRGTNHVLDDFESVLTRQPVKNSTLEHVYRKTDFTPSLGSTLSGFGFTHDGSASNIPRGHEYDQDRFRRYPNAEADVMAFLLTFSTGTAPAVGSTALVRSPSDSDSLDKISILESQASLGACDLTIHLISRDSPTSFCFDSPTGLYLTDSVDLPPQSLNAIVARISPDRQVLAIATLPGSGPRMSIQRSGSTLRNAQRPLPVTSLQRHPSGLLFLPGNSNSEWIPERSNDLRHWEAFPADLPIRSSASPTFFRLRRSW